uniref:NADH-ubiquinone oxidoreductase chain 2 n=1 Tax=Ornithodoros turicata TaxID=34597 RepID=A0A3G2KJY2_9ACAR|nr:NADH dehydrogenase subunit 2 [Ornithodoros turicata]
MKMSKIILMWFIMLSIIIAISSSSFLFLWMCLEINMMAFVPLMNSNNQISSNSMIFYFIIQALASSAYILTIIYILMNYMIMPEKLVLIIMCSMMIKIGAAPFHIWFPQVSEGISLQSLFLLSTIQKIIPLHISSMFINKFIFIIIIMSAMMGAFGGLNQFSIRKILAFSSITHLSWILSLITINSNTWLMYMLIYTVILAFIVNFMHTNNMNYINQTISFSKENSIYMIVLLMSLGGMPPMIGFFMKWMSLKIIILNMYILSIPLIISSLINLYYYTRLSYPFFLKIYFYNKWKLSKFNPMFLFLIMQFMIFIMIPLV